MREAAPTATPPTVAVRRPALVAASRADHQPPIAAATNCHRAPARRAQPPAAAATRRYTERVAVAGEIEAARFAGTNTASNPTNHTSTTPPTR